MTKVERQLQKLDATGKAPGRLATQIATYLIGKHKPSFAPNRDDGDKVEVVNASKMAITGKKVEQKVYHHHSMYPRGHKETPMKRVLASDPSDVLRRAVSRMLPKNSHRTERLKRLKITD
jgi:large subunit ribosomal protein L13